MLRGADLVRTRSQYVVFFVAGMALGLVPTFARGQAGALDPSFNGGQPLIVDVASGTYRRTRIQGLAVDAS